MSEVNSIEEEEYMASDLRMIRNLDRVTTELRRLDRDHHREGHLKRDTEDEFI
jgi:hypothetical protein